MTLRVLSLLWLLVACVSVTVALPPIQFTLYHQLIRSPAPKDITVRGVITYDPAANSAFYKAQSDVVDLKSNRGIYRIGLLDERKQELSPAAFTKLV